MVVFTNIKDKFYNEEKVPQSIKTTLHTQHRFGKHILHFVATLLSDAMKEKDDSELKIINKENASPEFLPIINPEKYVQFINISGKAMGKKNKWNKEEGDLIVNIVSEFIKSGVDRSSIGVIAPFERQKALIKKLLEEKKISDVGVFEPNEAEEKEVIIVDIVENNEVKSPFKKAENLKMALTRARSKLILVGNKTLAKKDKNLGKVIKK
jgi:superfamily I DNA and/or RNA helicase